LNLSYLLISHNLATVEHMSDRVIVMYLGQIVEEAESKELFARPLHPYTKALISAALPLHPDRVKDEGVVLHGEVPSPENVPTGCRFHPRCPFAMPQCTTVEPIAKEVAPRHSVSCHLY
jgi:oligopeptide/dipeptide ABC transporter ATP-binding protein